jgi:hypothetical protein
MDEAVQPTEMNNIDASDVMADIYLELRDRPIFICGHPKAGTSLVRSIFDFHPQIIAYPEETSFFRRYIPLASEQNINDQLDIADQKIIHIFTWNKESPPQSQTGFRDRDYSRISYEEVRKLTRRNIHSNYRHKGDILSAAVLSYGQATGQLTSNMKYWLEKSPYNEFFADQIFGWWPNATCIHVLRDPRDNYYSYRRKHPDWSAEFFAFNWNRSSSAGIKNMKRYGRKRYYLLQYENLTQFPKRTITELADFLNISWDETLTRPTRAGIPWIGNSLFEAHFHGISSEPVARWRDNLSSQDAAVIETISEEFIEKFRYPFEATPKENTWQKIATQWRVTSWPVRRRIAKLVNRNP